MTTEKLLARYPIISDQVSKQDLETVLEELERVLDRGVPGDIVEFGCYIGTTSLFIRRLQDEHRGNRTFHVYDSFEGLPPKSREDQSVAGDNFRAGQLAVSKKQFIREFQKAHLQLPVIHKGWFSSLAPSEVPDTIAFAFLDGDFYDSIRSSLKLVMPRMSQGGVIAIHDYAREALPGVARAVNEQDQEVAVRAGVGMLTIR